MGVSLSLSLSHFTNFSFFITIVFTYMTCINWCREFVGCVRCIRILSPTEVQQMSEEGMKLLNSACINDLKT